MGVFVAVGPAAGHNVYRFSLNTGIWRVSTLPFDVQDGGVAWLPGRDPGLYVLEGQAGSRVTQLVEAAADFTLFGTDGGNRGLYRIDPRTAAATFIAQPIR